MKIILPFFFIVLSSYGQHATLPTETPSARKQEACCTATSENLKKNITPESLYNLTSEWKDQSNTSRTLSSLKGRVQVLTMGYTTCQYACPRLFADMLTIERELDPEIRARVGFVFVSIDPDRDTPERLAEYTIENNIEDKDWTLLTGDEGGAQELAVLLGIQYRKVNDTDFAHSNLIIVLNKEGEIIHRQSGLSMDPTATILSINQIAN
jgi:protein SCO1/2